MAQGLMGPMVKNAPMKRYTSMRVGGTAPWLFYPEDAGDVARAMEWLSASGLPVRVLGNGTNVIVADGALRMGIIRTTRMRRLRFRTTGHGALVDAGCGLPLRTLITACAARGLSGLERLFGIPGTVGGAIRMNAGSFGASVSDRLVSVRCVGSKGLREVAAEEAKLGYRSSSFRDDECIVDATFSFDSGERGPIEAEMERVWRERLKKHPMDLPSAGSVFRNGSRPAWTYIEAAGLKGLTEGGACVSVKHANFIVNKGGASGSDVRHLIETVKRRVFEKTGARLVEEVELWGFE